MIIYLMRHGETNWNKEGRLQGQSDIPLNEFGIELAVKTAKGLQKVDFDAAFSSPLVRAKETAEIVLADRNVPLTTDERLKEINFGECEGAGFVPVKRDEGHPLHNFFCKPECYEPVKRGETLAQARARGQAFLQDVILPLEGRCKAVLIVAHGALNRTILNAVAGIPDKDFWRISLPNCAVSILELEKGKLRILEESKVYYEAPVNGRP